MNMNGYLLTRVDDKGNETKRLIGSSYLDLAKDMEEGVEGVEKVFVYECIYDSLSSPVILNLIQTFDVTKASSLEASD